ncbi:GNAT family acetyltransferase [bacterium]|nr:GNAT family acetyltransferase [bacterium]
MRIRPATREDRTAVADLWRLVFPDAPAHNCPEDDFDRKMLVHPELFLLAEDEGEIIGSVMGGYDGHRGWIYYMAVHPQQRRKGLGRSLMEAAESSLVKAGCPKVNLQVRAENHEVVSFYRSLGYSIEERASLGKRLQS